MVSRSTIQGVLALGTAMLLAACEQPMKKTGDNADTQATKITWTDGREAFRITCGTPSGCTTRAVAMCGDNYTVLSMTNMPTRGDATVVRGPGTVVVRCPG